MHRRSLLGPDPLATITFIGVALVATAGILGSSGIDGTALGVFDVLVALVPLLAVAGYLLWVNRDRTADDPVQRAAVSILTAQADDPTVRGDDAVSRAAADLVAALDEAERQQARVRLLEALSRRG